MINVLFVIESLGPGGKERRLSELLTYLESRGTYKITLILLDDVIHYSAIRDLKIKLEILARKKGQINISLFIRLIEIIQKEKPDILCTWGNISTLYVIPGTLLSGIPLVNCQVTSINPKEGKLCLFNKQLQFNFWASKIVISNSQAGLKSFMVPVKKGRVIYNGLNPDRFLDLHAITDVRRKYHIKSGICVAMVGTFSEYKDFFTFVKVAKEFDLSDKNISFLCIGGGEKLDQIKNYAQVHNIRNLIFTGTLDNVEDLINASDIGVLLSPIGEGISNSLMEFMYLNKPVIANNKGGTKELIIDGFNGYLIQGIKVEIISEKILTLSDNPELLKRIGTNAHQTICEKFMLHRMGDEFETAFKDTIVKQHSALIKKLTKSIC